MKRPRRRGISHRQFMELHSHFLILLPRIELHGRIYFRFMPHSMDSYWAAQIAKVQSSGLSPATIATQVAAIQRTQQLYQNPLVNMAYTFIEPFPVGLLITLLSALILRKRAKVPAAAPAPAR